MKKTLRKRVQKTFTMQSKVQPEFQKSVDIHNIIKNPLPEKPPMTYADLRGVPKFEEAFDIVQNAKEKFLQMPAEFRKLLDNDPKNLMKYINDESNNEILRKYNIISPKEEQVQTPPHKPQASNEPKANSGAEPV